MKKSNLLRKAKEIFECKPQPYEGICSLLYPKTLNVPEMNKKKLDELKIWIHKLLDGTVYYESWLAKKHNSKYREIKKQAKEDGKVIQGYFVPRYYFKQGRLDWLDWMIKIHEEHGD